MAVSLIVRTRKHARSLRRFTDSLVATTADPAGLEVLLVIDEDDTTYDDMIFEGLNVVRIRVPTGQTLSELNSAGYSACSGDYIMLTSDDVVVRTRHWDKIILSVFHDHPDGIVLVHVNDNSSGLRLCRPPFLTRHYWSIAKGIGPLGYRRYRFDDHMYNVFSLLGVLGHNRIVYLPDVAFEHVTSTGDNDGHLGYQPAPVIHEIDTVLFDATLAERKVLAGQLAEAIATYRRREVDIVRERVLTTIQESRSVHRADYVRKQSINASLNSDWVRVTIGVVTADVRSDYARTCVHAIKQYTQNYELIILDNNRAQGFNHSREMNRLIASCRTDYLVLMDDDVIVEAGWLNRLLAASGPGVGVVTPLQKSTDGSICSAGIIIQPDRSGHISHATAVHQHPFEIQTLCSAIMLIDLNKCGSLCLDESFTKYFLDVDYGLRVWEAGFSVVCTPEIAVTHIGGGTLPYESDASEALFRQQRTQFVVKWMDSGRYDALASGAMWAESAEIRRLLDLPLKVSAFLENGTDEDPELCLEEAHALFNELLHYPGIRNWTSNLLFVSLKRRKPDFQRAIERRYAALVGQFDYPVLIGPAATLFTIWLWKGRYYAVPGKSNVFEQSRATQGLYHSALRLRLLLTDPDAKVSAAIGDASPKAPANRRLAEYRNPKREAVSEVSSRTALSG